VLGTNFGAASEVFGRLDAEAADRSLASYSFPAAAAALARAIGFGGPRTVLSLSCASGTAAIVTAAGLIRSGRAALAVAAGFDELSFYSYAGLSALHAITPDTVRPFDRRRAGTLFAEGAGALILEPLEAARARGARILAELLGGAMNNDAYHMTAPEKEGAGIRLLMRTALVEAEIEPGEIDHINAHATGTEQNDRTETAAIKEVFGPRAGKIPIAANKSLIGHAMGAAGSLESIATILALRDGVIPPTAGLEEPDPECDLDYVPGAAREAKNMRTALKCSYGLGGTNAAAVFRKAAGA